MHRIKNSATWRIENALQDNYLADIWQTKHKKNTTGTLVPHNGCTLKLKRVSIPGSRRILWASLKF